LGSVDQSSHPVWMVSDRGPVTRFRLPCCVLFDAGESDFAGRGSVAFTGLGLVRVGLGRWG